MTKQNTDNITVTQNVIGNVPKFNHEVNAFDIFKIQLQQFFIVNEITSDVRKKALLLTALSENSYILLKNLLNPLLPEEDAVTFDQCVEILAGHFKPVVSVFTERLHFYNAQKSSTESVSQWAARVQGLAVNCAFGNLLETAIRDKFVLGLERGPARDKIFLEGIEKATFKKSIEIAITAEYIQRQTNEEQSTENCLHIACSANKKQQQQQKQQKQQRQQQQQHNSSSQYQKQSKQLQQKPGRQQCMVCGFFNHKSEVCRFKNYKCNKCQVRGHLKKMCTQVNCNFVEENDSISLFAFQGHYGTPIEVQILINNRKLVTELDTGSQVCIMPMIVLKENFGDINLTHTKLLLRTYAGNIMKPEGTVMFQVTYNGTSQNVSFVIVKEKGPILLGRDFMRVFNMKLANMNNVSLDKTHEKWMQKFPKLFDGKLGCFNKSEAHLMLKADVIPKFFRPRPLALALKEKVEAEIEKLVKLNVLEPIDFSEWGTPIVPVLKKNGEVRICGDYKVTVNPCIQVEKYPLPRIEDLFSKLCSGKEFSKLDLSMAYQQIKLNDQSKKLTTISTTKGLFQYNRLIYGLASAPAIFQKIMEALFANLEGVAVFLDISRVFVCKW